MGSLSSSYFLRCRYLLFPWLGLICLIPTLGWALTAIHHLDWLIPISQLLYLGLIIHYSILFNKIDHKTRDILTGPFKYLPFLLVSSLILIAGFSYNPNQLDALSYRLPRIYMWLQEGGVYFIPTADQRMNYMPIFWELNSLPFFGFFGDRGFWILNFLAWIALWLTLLDFTDYGVKDQTSRNRIALIFLLSYFAVLQAPSTMNDLLATSLLLMSTAFIMRFELVQDGRDIIASGLAFAACTGTKPHFILFGIPWLLWFILSKEKPWKIFSWRIIPLLVPVVLAISAIPTLISNQIHFGSIKGELTGDALNYGSFLNNVLIGTFSFLWGAGQPPINPLAEKWNGLSEKCLDLGGYLGSHRHFSPQVREIITVDAASLGILVLTAVFIGIFLSIKKDIIKKSILVYFFITGALIFVIAIFNVVPGTISRSFFGFSILEFPLAIVGFSYLSPKVQKVFLWLSLIAIFSIIILTPAHPLWPVKTVSNILKTSSFAKTGKALEGRYLTFTHRYNAGKALLETLPQKRIKIAVAASGDHALLQLWKPKRQLRNIHFLQKEDSLKQAIDLHPDYILVMKTPDTQIFDELDSEVATSLSFQLIEEQSYQSKASRGIDTWKLYKTINN